jgi:hypothetical protein
VDVPLSAPVKEKESKLTKLPYTGKEQRQYLLGK